MKYSVRGTIKTDEPSDMMELINSYTLWRLITSQRINDERISWFIFEVWLENVIDKDSLFEELKQFVDLYGGNIDWHECTHDEPVPAPCEIVETYAR